jgi:hypothetical protein
MEISKREITFNSLNEFIHLIDIENVGFALPGMLHTHLKVNNKIQ